MTITFQVQVEQVDGVTLVNEASIADAALAEPIIVTAETTVPPIWWTWLPLVSKNAP